MAVTIEIRSFHGASPDAGTDRAGGTVRFKQADNDTVDANNPIPIPGGGTNYSFKKQFRYYAPTLPANVIDTLRWYTDGANTLGTGVGLVVKSNATYQDPIALGSADMTGTTDAFASTSGSPLTVTGQVTSSDSTGAFGDYVHMQMTVVNTASSGTTPSETTTFQYDES